MSLQTTEDCWGWAESPNVGRIYPTYGYGKARMAFPPRPGYPSINFRKYDPIAPNFNAPGPTASFLGYGTWAGWNFDKSATYLAGTRNADAVTPYPGPLGSDPHIVRVDTSDDNLGNWTADWDNAFYLSAAVVGGSNIDVAGSVGNMRFVPTTNHIVFLADEDGVRKLFRLLTDTNTLSVLATEVVRYAYSYDGAYVVIQFSTSGVGTRVFTRDSIGTPLVDVTGANIFAHYPSNFFFTDGSRYIVTWDPSNHYVYDGVPPFGFEFAVPTSIGTGLFGPTPSSIGNVSVHPDRTYVARYRTVGLGLGGSNDYHEILTWFGEFVTNSVPGQDMDWSQTGDVIIGTDGGRDPYGGHGAILKTGTWQGDSTTAQEWGGLRIRPFH